MEKLNEQFKEWLSQHYTIKYNKEADIKALSTLGKLGFDRLPSALKWGVYLEFFDSVGIVISLGKLTDKYSWSIKLNNQYRTSEQFNTRTEAQQAAIKKAFEILEKEIQ